MWETEVVPVDDETEVEFRLPCGADPRLDQIPEDVPVVTGAAGAEADKRDPAQTRRSGPQSRAKPKWPRSANSGITQVATGRRDAADEAGDLTVSI